MRVSRDCWKCEFPGCGHVWIATGVDPPYQCAKCKKRHWHTYGSVESPLADSESQSPNGSHLAREIPPDPIPTRRKRQPPKERISPEDLARIDELNADFDKHLERQRSAPERLAAVLAQSVPGVKTAAEILAPADSKYIRPVHSADTCRNRFCLICNGAKDGK